MKFHEVKVSCTKEKIITNYKHKRLAFTKDSTAVWKQLVMVRTDPLKDLEKLAFNGHNTRLLLSNLHDLP